MAHKTKPSYGFKIYLDEGMQEFRYTFYMDPPDIRAISLKGGGTRAIVYNKFIEEAHKSNLLAKVEEIGGSSSGSIASAFAAVHYEDPEQRTQALDDISEVDKQDIYGDTNAWLAYQIITSPLYLISKPFSWGSKGVHWLGDQCNRVAIGKLVGYPLKFIGMLLGAVSKLTSPRVYAGFANLISRGAVYRGDKFQERVRHHYQRDVAAGLQAIFNKLEPEQKASIAHRLIDIGLLRQREDGKLTVVADITFRHLHELTLLPGSQFKRYFTTGVRKRDGAMIVFNDENTPDMPVHLAVRLAITFPLYYQAGTYEGDQFLDGGIVDNSPVQQIRDKPMSKFAEANGVTDKLARLNVRVEYPHEQDYHLWRKQPPASKLGKLMRSLLQALAKLVTARVDSFAADEEVTRVMQKDYAQRTLQLPDFGIGQMQKVVYPETHQIIDQEMPHIVQRYFENHKNEKAVVENFQDVRFMPSDKRRKLLKILQDENIKTEDIFDLPGKSWAEVEAMRMMEIRKLQQASSVFDNDGSDTAAIYRALDSIPDMKGFTLTPVNDVSSLVSDDDSFQWDSDDNEVEVRPVKVKCK